MSGRLIARLAHWKEQKGPDGGKGVLLNHWRHPEGLWEISDFLLTFLIMDVPELVYRHEHYYSLTNKLINNTINSTLKEIV
jgi:hypothetical protein